MRRLGGVKKLRGVRRRLRFLDGWARGLEGFYPSDIEQGQSYWSVKIPVVSSLVDGKYTSVEIRSLCAQILIDAAYNIYKSKPDGDESRVMSVISLPQMFSSEICVFMNESYFKTHTEPGVNVFGKISTILGKSICSDWGLVIPDGFSERGVRRDEVDEDGNYFQTEYWYIGEVEDR